MRLGSKTDDEFLIKLNEKNSQIQSIFHGKIKEIAKKHLVDVMMQDGTVKKQETFEVEKINQIYNRFANGLQAWTLEGISSTNDEGIRRNFIKLNTNADDCKISLHLSIQYQVFIFGLIFNGFFELQEVFGIFLISLNIVNNFTR